MDKDGNTKVLIFFLFSVACHVLVASMIRIIIIIIIIIQNINPYGLLLFYLFGLPQNSLSLHTSSVTFYSSLLFSVHPTHNYQLPQQFCLGLDLLTNF
jgi:hypothetical protein